MARVILISFLLLFLSGCATLPSNDEMLKEITNLQLPHAPKEGYGTVYVVRPGSVGGLIRFNVFLDDTNANSEMGWTRGAQCTYFYAKPGEHKVFSKAENWDKININVAGGKEVFIKQDAEMGIIIARNKLSEIKEVEGKYHVKKLAPGNIIKVAK